MTQKRERAEKKNGKRKNVGRAIMANVHTQQKKRREGKINRIIFQGLQSPATLHNSNAIR